jgi:protocatechuate 3,4-dioxygenase beta subunit
MEIVMKMKYIILGITLFSLILQGTAYSQPSVITNGVNWLKSAQSSDGYWGDASEVSCNTVVDTCIVAESLRYLNETGSAYNSSMQWINSMEVINNDYLFTKMLVLGPAGYDVSPIRDYMLSVKNTDGGWGVIEGFESDIKRTALALQALKAANYSDINTIGTALGFLISTQNADGGWGFYPSACSNCEADPSNVYMTAIVSSTLQKFPQTTSLATSIHRATGYLIIHQNADGGFGSDQSTIYETALVYIALAGVTTDATVLGNATNYLLATQLPNGSWNDDPYSTALALRALYISQSKPTPPPQPDKGTVIGTVLDGSTNMPLKDVSVAVGSYPPVSTTTDTWGNFTLPGIPSGNQGVNFSLAGYTTTSAEVTITAGSVISLGNIFLSPNPATGIVKGTVTDASNDQPLPGTTIEISGSLSGAITTGSDGTFTFTNVPPGTVNLTASKSGYYSVSGSGTVEAGGILFFNPQLSTTPPAATTGSLIGKVFDAVTKNPIQGASISLAGGPFTSTDAQGAFVINDISPNTYQATISQAGYMDQVYQAMIMAGVTTDMQIIYLTPALQSTTITGRVTDGLTGNPIVNAEVAIIGTTFSVRTDSTGLYTITGINSLEFNLQASATGYDSKTINITTAAYGTQIPI